MNKRLLFVLSLFIAGCTTMGAPYSPPPPAPPGKALVYFMRTSVGYGNFWSTSFSVNDAKIVSVYDKGYSWIHLDSGLYKFSAGTVLKADYLKFVMPIEAGKEYFIEYSQESTGYQMYRNVIRAVPPNVGKGLVEKYSYQEADKVEIPNKPK
jgi:Protein of unknown function (DUF2846)